MTPPRKGKVSWNLEDEKVKGGSSTAQAEALGKEGTGCTRGPGKGGNGQKGHRAKCGCGGRARASRQLMGKILAGVLRARGSPREVWQRVCGDKMCILERSFWLPYGKQAGGGRAHLGQPMQGSTMTGWWWWWWEQGAERYSGGKNSQIMGWTESEKGRKGTPESPGSCTEFIVAWGFPGGSDGKESACSVGNLGLVPGLGRSLGEGNGSLL